MSSFVKTAKSSIEEECASLESLLQTERKSRVANSETNAEFFCSQSVATVLKAMGVLPSSIPTTEYLPCSFSSYIGLPLLKGASFSKEVYIRGICETMSALAVPKVSEEGEKMEGSDVSVEGSEKMEGDVKKSCELQVKYIPLIKALFSEVNPIPVKKAMNLMGMEVGSLRLPLTEMEEEHAKKLAEEMKKAGITLK